MSSSGNVSVTVNGQPSASASWPYSTSGTTGNVFSLNQTGLVLTQGQTATLTASNASSIYLFNNTNPSIVNVSINGVQITVSANSNGSTIFTLCSDNSSNCIGVYVTVQSGNSQLLTFGQNNVTVATGQTLPISIYGGSGVYSVVSNSNTGVVQASLSANTVNLTGNSSYGKSSITLCTQDQTSCGIINVTIGSSNSSSLTFSQTNPTIAIGQTISVDLSGSSGLYSISLNSNANSLQASISGNTLTLLGVTYGSVTIVVCSSTRNCGNLLVSVTSGGGGCSITLSQTSLILVTGQTVSVSISGGSVSYDISANSSNIVQTTSNSNMMTVTAVSASTTQINVCSAQGGCVALAVTLNGTSAGTTLGNAPGLSQVTVNLGVGQTMTVIMSGSGGYYIARNTNNFVATVSISG